MKLKLNEDGFAVVQDGKPVYVHDDGKETPFDVPDMYSRLNSDGRRNAELRSELKSLQEKLKAFDGLEDPAAARKALETIKNIDAKKLVDAGAVEAIKAEAQRAYEDKLKALVEPLTKERDSYREALVSEKIGGSFARSKFIADKLAIPADIAQAAFGAAFKLEDNAVVAYDKSGNKIFSRSKPGDVADFDEALELMVEAYPLKDHILKGTGASGSGAQGTMRGGKRTFTRTELDQWSMSDPSRAATMMRDVREGKAELVDG